MLKLIAAFAGIFCTINAIYELVFGSCAHAFAASVDSNSHIYIAEDSFACKFTLQNLSAASVARKETEGEIIKA